MLRFKRALVALSVLLASHGAAQERPAQREGSGVDDSPSLGAPDSEERTLPAFAPPAPSAPEVIARDTAGRITVRATRVTEPIAIDGRLDDRVYATVRPFTGFVQQEPVQGESATEDSDVWILFDDRNLYVSVRCWDSHPELMLANEMRRDHNNIRQNENFTVVLDTNYDRRSGFYFATNPLGALRDQSVGDEGQSRNVDWDTVWNVKATMDDEGWTFEMIIPFKSL